MTPPENLFIGFSLGNIIYSIQTFFKKIHVSYIVIIILSGLFAIFPDIDSFFGNYASKNVFTGHRGITHSLLFVCVVSICITLLLHMINRALNKADRAGHKSTLMVIFITLFLAGISHVLLDLPQPSSIWGGIPVFFPLSSNGEYARMGGFSKIGWYDYAIQWLYICLFAISFLLIIASKVLKKYNFDSAATCIAVAVILINLSSYIWTWNYINRSNYVNGNQWNTVQNQYLDDLGPIIKAITLKSKECFLAIFHKVR
ncbi:MAG: metal-dependent hydrolase [Spirochaetes bacterium]|nr:metal-dependent hydrolase [Spirochaetota bacterium]